MSSKLVKKLLLAQTTTPLLNSEDVDGGNIAGSKRKRKRKITTATPTNIASREDIVQEHIQSLLRFDDLTTRYTTSTATKAFNRQSTLIKSQTKERKKSKKTPMSNSRSCSSSFSKKEHERRYDKKWDAKKKEKEHFSELRRALNKANSKKKRRMKSDL